jgi:hypothetical protein
MVDALSWRYVFLLTLNASLLGFEYVKYLYDDDFNQVYKACENLTFDKFFRFDGYLFKEKRLCVKLFYAWIVLFVKFMMTN